MTETLVPVITSLRIETERLRGRNWREELARPEDRAQLIAVLEPILRPEVLRDLPPSMQVLGTPDSISAWIDARMQESECFLIRRRSDGRVLGLLILAEMPDVSPVAVLHLGYLLRQDAWGQGYATEIVAGLVTALTPHAPLQLLGGVAKRNPVSAHVLRKLGFEEDMGNATDDTVFFALNILKDSD